MLPAAVQILLVQARGLDLFQIGAFMGVYSLTIIILEVPTGGLSDTIGRKRTMVLALAFTLASEFVLLFAFSLSAFLAFAVLSGIGRALASGALEAWFIDSLQTADPDIEIQPALALAGSFELFALGAGTLLSGFIPTFFSALPQEGTAVFTPFSMTVAFSILMFTTTLLVVAWLVREDHSSRGTVSGFRALPDILSEAFGLSRRNPTILLLLGAALASGFVLSGVETFWQPRFATLLGDEDSSVVFGLLLAGSFGLGMVGNLLSTPLSRRFRKRYGLLAALSQGVQGGVLVLLALQTTVPSAAALFWLVYFSRGTLHSPHSTLFNSEVPKARRSVMLSVQSLANYTGFFLGNLTLGYIAERAGIPTAWLLAGGVTMLSLVFYLRVDARTSRTPASPR